MIIVLVMTYVLKRIIPLAVCWYVLLDGTVYDMNSYSCQEIIRSNSLSPWDTDIAPVEQPADERSLLQLLHLHIAEFFVSLKHFAYRLRR
jgi:hypothetical protein